MLPLLMPPLLLLPVVLITREYVVARTAFVVFAPLVFASNALLALLLRLRRRKSGIYIFIVLYTIIVLWDVRL